MICGASASASRTGQLEMLGGECLGEAERSREVGNLDEPRDGAGLRPGFEPRGECVEQRARGRDGDDECSRPVLGLREQIECERIGVDPLIGEQQQIARAGEAVDPDLAEHLALGLLHEQVSWADDDVDRVDRLGAVGERGDGLRASHAVDDARAGQPAGGEHDRVHVTVLAGRCAYGDLARRRPRWAVTTPITTVLG